jgi:hypothetical protein
MVASRMQIRWRESEARKFSKGLYRGPVCLFSSLSDLPVGEPR